MIVKIGESKELVFQNQTFNGLSLKHYVVHGTLNTALTNDDSVPANIFVKITLLRGKRSVVIAQENLQVLHMGSNFLNGSFDLQKVGGGADATYIALVTQAAGAYGTGLWAYNIDLGGAINLSGSDELRVLISQAGNAAVASDMNTSTSYLDVDVNECPGEYEHGTPYIETYAISANESRVQRSLGDNVTEIQWINTDKSSALITSQVLSNVSISSKTQSVNDVYIEILAKQVKFFETLAAPVTRYQSALLYKGNDLDGVTVDIQGVSANINASKNFLFVRKMYTDGRLITLANAKQEKHAMQKAIKIGAVPAHVGAQAIEHADSVIQLSRPRK